MNKTESGLIPGPVIGEQDEENSSNHAAPKYPISPNNLNVDSDSPSDKLLKKIRKPKGIPRKLHTFDAFHSRNYRFLWLATAIFSSGFWLQQVVVGWLAYEITGSPLLTSMALGLDALPILVGAPFGGLISDKFNKKILLSIMYSYQAVLMIGYSVVIAMGYANIWNLFIFIFLVGISWIINDPARMSLLAVIIPKKNLINAFALNSMAFSVMRLLIPAAGGFSLAIFGPAPLFIVEAILMFSAATAIMMIQLDKDFSFDNSDRSAKQLLADLKSGVTYVVNQKTIIGLTFMTVNMVILVMPFVHGLMPVYAAEVFEVGPQGLGLLLSAAGLGSLIGTVILASCTQISRPGKILFVLLGFLGVLMATLAITNIYSVAMIVIMLLSGSMMSYFSISGATVQGILPDQYRGRVTGIYMMAWGLMPVGSLLAGSIANVVGPQLSTLIGSSLIFVSLIAATYCFKGVWKYRLEEDSSG